MHAFAQPVLSRGSAALLSLAVAWLLAGCGGGGSSSAAAGDPNQLTFDELVIPAGEERVLSAEQVTIRTRFDVKGTLALSLPSGSTTDRVTLQLPPGTRIEGTIELRQPAPVAAAASLGVDGRKVQASSGRPAAFVPRPVPHLLIQGIPGAPLIVSSKARFVTPAGEDAPDEVFADLRPIGNGNSLYFSSAGGKGGDIWFSTLGVVVFEIAPDAPPRANFAPFAPGNGGKGADVVVNDGTWNDAGIKDLVIRAGPGGRSGRVLVDAAELRLDGGEPGAIFLIVAAPGTGIGGAGGKIVWDVVRPDLASVEDITMIGGAGGSGIGEGGPGGHVRFAAGKPIVPATAPRPVRVMVQGGSGGIGGDDVQGAALLQLPQLKTPREPWIGGRGGAGGSLTAVAHTGWPGTRDHPDGYEPGPMEVLFGDGGGMSRRPFVAGFGGSGAGMEAGVSVVHGGDGGDGWSACGDPPGTGGAGGRSGHVSVRAGVGGDAQAGGDSGALRFDGVELGRPGRGGNGVPGGAAGFYGQPKDAVPADVQATDVRDEAGLRLIGVRGGSGVEGDDGAGSTIQGAYVMPARTAGAICNVVPPIAGRIALPAASYRERYFYSASSNVVSELLMTTSEDCLFLDTRPGFLGAGYVDPTRACVTIHEVVRVPSDLDPRGYSEQVTDRSSTVIDTSRSVRPKQFLLRQ